MSDVQKCRRVEKRYFADSKNRGITMLTDLETGETKFAGKWVFMAKMSDGQGNLYEQENPQVFNIEVEGEGKSTERVNKAFDVFDKARDKCLEMLNASRSKIQIAGNQ